MYIYGPNGNLWKYSCIKKIHCDGTMNRACEVDPPGRRASMHAEGERRIDVDIFSLIGHLLAQTSQLLDVFPLLL